jgi:hypothetical protein
METGSRVSQSLLDALSEHAVLLDAWRDISAQGLGICEWMAMGPALLRAPVSYDLSVFCCQTPDQCLRAAASVDAVATALREGQLQWSRDPGTARNGLDPTLSNIMSVAICGNAHASPPCRAALPGLVGSDEAALRLRRLADTLRSLALVG